MSENKSKMPPSANTSVKKTNVENEGLVPLNPGDSGVDLSSALGYPGLLDSHGMATNILITRSTESGPSPEPPTMPPHPPAAPSPATKLQPREISKSSVMALEPPRPSKDFLESPMTVETLVGSHGRPHTPSRPRSQSFFDRLLPYLSRVRTAQDDVITLRLRVQEKRNELGKQRRMVSDCDRIFMDVLRKYWSQEVREESSYLRDLYDECEIARDIAGPTEAEFEEIDLQLGRAEFKLEEQIRHIEDQYRLGGIDALVNAPEKDTQGSVISYYTQSEDVEGGVLGEGPLFQEPSDVKVGQYPTFSTFHARHHSGDSPMIEIGRSTLYTVPEPTEPPTRDFDRVLLDLAAPELKATTPWTPSEGEQPPESLPTILEGDTTNPTPVSDSQTDGVDELFIVEDDTCSVGSRSALSEYIQDFNSTKDRVSRWMLHRLRSSQWEVYDLRARIRATSPEVNDWPRLSLDLWDQDEEWPSSAATSEYVEKVDTLSHHSPQSRQPSPYPGVNEEDRKLFDAIMASFRAESPERGRKRKQRPSEGPSAVNSLPAKLSYQHSL